MMNKASHNKNQLSLSLLIILIFCLWLSGCAAEDDNGLPKPPLRLPFAVQKAGTKIETEIEVVDYRNYIFSLAFKFNEHDQSDRARVKKLVGDRPHANTNDGDPGVPTPLHFRISQIDASGEKPVFDQELKELRLMSWGGNRFDKHIAFVSLKPGHYRISVESLRDAPELIGTPVIFGMGSDPKASNIE